MDEPALSFEGVTLSPQKETVRMFYKDMWDHADKSLIRKIFHQGISPFAARSGRRSPATTSSPATSTE